MTANTGLTVFWSDPASIFIFMPMMSELTVTFVSKF